jgi:hypothetical protein
MHYHVHFSLFEKLRFIYLSVSSHCLEDARMMRCACTANPVALGRGTASPHGSAASTVPAEVTTAERISLQPRPEDQVHWMGSAMT